MPRIIEVRKRAFYNFNKLGEINDFSNSVFFSLPFFKGREDEKYLK